jgi:very-short-patch-repair endonuclease
VNQWLTAAGEELQVDFAWHRERVIAETDGFDTHRTRQAFRRDRRRDRLLSLAGWRVVRFTWDDVTGDPSM